VDVPNLARAVHLPSVCGEEDETGENHLLQCDACRAFVHMDCYGVAASPESAAWLCDVCALGALCTPASPPILSAFGFLARPVHE
jgi:hypothetical protein